MKIKLKKKLYKPPVLLAYGRISKLTQSGSGNPENMGMGMGMGMGGAMQRA